MAHRVTLIPGDGTGSELTEATRRVLEATGGMSAADRLERAIAEVIREGGSVTYDLKPSRNDPTSVGTSEVADAIINRLSQPVAEKV